ncbi:hypothetical protein BSLG_003267 [Batrachochytrium salamandrivorans]|nr:hypothetical protein BSLG_003267 [Batrachochytrium salamandrivorans]
MRYAQTLPGPRFLTSTAVVMSELIKLVVSLIIHLAEERRTTGISGTKLMADLFGPNSDWLKMTVPAVLYFIQNNLQYVAVHLLDAATFQVTYQMKIITTALFSVWLLSKSLSLLKWISLGILTIGIAIVQLAGKSTTSTKGAAVDPTITTDTELDLTAISSTDRFLGLVAVTIACLLSGLAGVWFEKVLKGTKASLFLRNVQLSLFSVISGVIFGVILVDGAAVAEAFSGIQCVGMAAILCQAVGGLIVAVVVKYADNILKGFATSIAIILSSVASVFIFNFEITMSFMFGSGLVLYAFRDIHFPQLSVADRSNIAAVYLDSAGAPPVPAAVVTAHAAALGRTLLANPHSGTAPAAVYTASRIDQVRQRILRHFGVSSASHTVVFAANASAAIKIVADHFPWTGSSLLCYHQSSHTSVVGIRSRFSHPPLHMESVRCVNDTDIDNAMKEMNSTTDITTDITTDMTTDMTTDVESISSNQLSTEENINATLSTQNIRYLSTSTRNAANSHCSSDSWKVLLDCASFVASAPLDLQATPADFAVISFYKMFGFPTGLGALIVRNDAAKLLLQTSRCYFGGGTVAAIAADTHYQTYKSGISEQLENGTLAFTEILSLIHGFNFIENTIVCRIYPNMDHTTSASPHPLGPIISFNIQDDHGELVHHAQLMRLAGIHNIHLRAGCFCNPGACQKYLNISSEDIRRNHEVLGHFCDNTTDVGVPTGALRISFGFANILADVDVFIQFLNTFYVSTCAQPVLRPGDLGLSKEIHHMHNDENGGGHRVVAGVPRVKGLYVYPIKSCGPFSVDAWPISAAGLCYDRYWMLVDSVHERPLTQKKMPADVLYAHPLQMTMARVPDRAQINPPNVGAKRLENEQRYINEWFSKHLEMSVRLIECESTPSQPLDICHDSESSSGETLSMGMALSTSFANQSPYLVVSQSSFDVVAAHVAAHSSQDHFNILTFRPNIVIEGLNPFEEDLWISRTIGVGRVLLQITDHCQRCQMICIDQLTAQRYSEPLSTLARMRKIKLMESTNSWHSLQPSVRVRIVFGVHAQNAPTQSASLYHVLRVGDLYYLP